MISKFGAFSLVACVAVLCTGAPSTVEDPLRGEITKNVEALVQKVKDRSEDSVRELKKMIQDQSDLDPLKLFAEVKKVLDNVSRVIPDMSDGKQRLLNGTESGSTPAK